MYPYIEPTQNPRSQNIYYVERPAQTYRRPKKATLPLPFSIMRRIFRPIMRFCRSFCLWTSMHGFNHIACPRRHPFERLLWAFVTAAAIWGAVDISLGQLQRYNDSPTVVTIEKDFRTWRFSLPSITACEKVRVKASKLPQVIQAFWNITPEHEKYDYYRRFVETVANADIFHLSGFEEFKHDETLNVNMMQLVQDVVPEMLTVKDTWPEDLSPTWFPVMTEAGACYNVNSLTIADVATGPVNPNETKSYPLTCKYSSSTCAVMLEVFHTNFTFYLHSPYDIMDITTPPKCDTVFLRSRTTGYNVIETRSGKGIKDLTPLRRACRYSFEPQAGMKKVFSTNSCRLTCRAKLAVKLCGCKPFYYFYEDGPICNPSGMACLAGHATSLANFAGQRCPCAQQCVTSVFQETGSEDVWWDGGPFASRGTMRLIIHAPKTRYTREIVFHFQDLVVSFGGAAGLFLGASFISFVEILYFILERFFSACVGAGVRKEEDKSKKIDLKIAKNEKIAKLKSIVERQRRFEHGRHMKLYY